MSYEGYQQNDMNIFPHYDWQMTRTKEKLEHEINNFKFKGVGWYKFKEDAALIVALDENLYRIYVWNGNTVDEIIENLKELIKQPVYE